MAPKQFQLDGPSLEELKARILAEHGSRARVIAADKVRVGGIWGFFAREHYEVTVEVPERTRRGAHVLLETPPRAGITALLNDAEEAEAQLHGGESTVEVSTGSERFAKLMDDLTFNTAPVQDSLPEGAPEPVRPTGPGPLRGAGDLVAVIGLSEDALLVARAMAAAADSAAVAVAGALAQKVPGAGAVARAGVETIEDRTSAITARAKGVAAGKATFVAFGLEAAARNAAQFAAMLNRVGADQVWIAVNAGRKPEDTALWVQAATTALPAAAMAVVGCGGTQTPHTVNELGLPVGWVDGETSTVPSARQPVR